MSSSLYVVRSGHASASLAPARIPSPASAPNHQQQPTRRAARIQEVEATDEFLRRLAIAEARDEEVSPTEREVKAVETKFWEVYYQNAFVSHDANGDGKLDQHECAHSLQLSPPHIPRPAHLTPRAGKARVARRAKRVRNPVARIHIRFY